tara:strand:+ start:606 stop:773 length:168 start_codon:yes stop_codon:yes gene_type:complete
MTALLFSVAAAIAAAWSSFNWMKHEYPLTPSRPPRPRLRRRRIYPKNVDWGKDGF